MRSGCLCRGLSGRESRLLALIAAPCLIWNGLPFWKILWIGWKLWSGSPCCAVYDYCVLVVCVIEGKSEAYKFSFFRWRVDI